MSSVKTTCKDIVNPKVSVIVPVWNPGPGISRCIESLRNQTLSDIEMIFVDDCGTDDSMEKVRIAASEDSRIRIIENEENIGAGPSRNKGIEAARGEYLSFVDADDYVTADFLELLYSEAKNLSLDIAKGSRILQKENGEIIIPNVTSNQLIQEGLVCGKPLYLLFANEHHTAIFKRETVINKNARYGTSTRGEDTLFLLKICSQTDSFGLENDAQYYYCERPNGAISIMNPAQLDGHLRSTKDVVAYLLKKPLNDSWSKDYIRRRFLYSLKEAWRYKKNSEMRAPLLNYTRELRNLFVRLPYHKELAEQTYSLRVLEEYEVILPIWAKNNDWEETGSPEEFVDLVGLWIEHLLKHKKYTRDCIKELGRIVASARLVLRNDSGETENAKDVLENQLSRLSTALHFKVLVFATIYAVRTGMSRVMPQDIKRIIRNCTTSNK